MDTKDIAKMTGQSMEERTPAFKLNEVRFSGDTGEFTFINILGGKKEDNKYETRVLGKTLKGIIIKMRWRLSKYEENKPSINTSEFDNKNTDKIVVFGSNEKGFAVDIKEKYGLPSQRVLYIYVPSLKETVRLIVKASALSGEKNKDGELGLFEYVDSFTKEGSYIHEHNTEFGGVWREDEKNKRKSYFAMTFKKGDKVLDENIEKIVDIIKEVHERTTGTPFADTYTPPKEDDAIQYPSEDINPDDIPF